MAVPIYLPQQANIRAYYNLNDVNDGSGNSYNLTNYNSVTFTSAKVGNGANFGASNTNKYLRVASDLGITNGAITVSMLIKYLASSSGEYWNIFNKDDAGTHVSYTFFDDSRVNNIVTFRRIKYGAGYNEVAFDQDLNDSKFHLLTGVYDASNLNIYLDGVSMASPVAASGNGSFGYFDEMAFGAGSFEGTPFDYSSVLIDELTIWNKALTADEILALYKHYFGSGGILNWFFFKDSWEKHDKLWKPQLGYVM